MNIAFSSFILIWILLPGIVFNYSYNIDPIKEIRFKTNFGSLLVWSIIPGIIIQFVGLLVVGVFGYDFEFELIGYLLLGMKSDTKALEVFKEISKFKYEIFIYFICIIVFSKFLGYFLLKLVWKFRLDMRFEFFKFKNTWFYSIYNRAENVDFIIVRAIIEMGGVIFEYSGILKEYTFEQNNKLGMIKLIYPVLRSL